MPRDWDAAKRQGRQAEDAFQVWAQATEVHHKGWPDFLCVIDGIRAGVNRPTPTAAKGAEPAHEPVSGSSMA